MNFVSSAPPSQRFGNVYCVSVRGRSSRASPVPEPFRISPMLRHVGESLCAGSFPPVRIPVYVPILYQISSVPLQRLCIIALKCLLDGLLYKGCTTLREARRYREVPWPRPWRLRYCSKRSGAYTSLSERLVHCSRPIAVDLT